MFKPLLAEAVNLPTLRYPTWASPKYDGFRCVINQMRQPMSRNLKPVANAYVFGKLSELNLPQLDGELLTYTNGKVDDFNTVQSKLSTRSGMPDFQYMVFDYWANPNQPYGKRNSDIRDIFGSRAMPRLVHVQQTQIDNEEQLLDYEARCLQDGWEGVMVRDPDSPYKFGRSTTKEGILLKLKRFFDAEAVVVSAHELLHNANEATTNALGHTERSSHKAGMRGMDTLGKFTVRWGEVEFDIGTGFTMGQRDQYWAEEGRCVGKTLTFKYQSIGPNGKPRFPVFLGFRHDA
jgi:DNA ligase-1